MVTETLSWAIIDVRRRTCNTFQTLLAFPVAFYARSALLDLIRGGHCFKIVQLWELIYVRILLNFVAVVWICVETLLSFLSKKKKEKKKIRLSIFFRFHILTFPWVPCYADSLESFFLSTSLWCRRMFFSPKLSFQVPTISNLRS